MRIFVARECLDSEKRVSVIPEIAMKFISMGNDVFIENDAGVPAGFSNSAYREVGCNLVSIDEIKNSDMILSVNPMGSKVIKKVANGAILISLQKPFINRENILLFRNHSITAFALDLVPRTTRAQYMDVLSSQSSLAGYKAVIEASHLFNRAMPLMMTTAGTIPAAKVLIIGAGVAGLQAIATAKRLGAIVSAFDVRAAAREQVESLGAKFVEVESTVGGGQNGVYASEVTEEYKKAQENKLRSVLPLQDIIITTAQIPGRRAPVILTDDMFENNIKEGAIIIDLASETGGNCASTKHGEIVEKHRAHIVAFENILSLIAYDASRLFSKNVFAFAELLLNKLKESPDNLLSVGDDIIKATLLTHNGEIVHEKFAE